MKSILIRMMVILLAAFSPSVGSAESSRYGEVFNFRPERNIDFPDFRLQFVEQKPGTLYPGSTSRRLGDIYEFRVIAGGADQIVRWSSGTGDIAPSAFKVQRKCFWLELQSSDKLGKLDENQAVVSLRSSQTDCR